LFTFRAAARYSVPSLLIAMAGKEKKRIEERGELKEKKEKSQKKQQQRNWKRVSVDYMQGPNARDSCSLSEILQDVQFLWFQFLSCLLVLFFQQ
jgi:hypothetical protein